MFNFKNKYFFGDNVVIVNGKVISGGEIGKKRKFDEKKSQDVSSVEKIVIDSSVVAVNVMSTDASNIKVHFYGEAIVEGDVDFDVQVAKHELRITLEINGYCQNSNLKLDVAVPEQKTFDVVCGRSSSAHITIDRCISTEKLKMETVSGCVFIKPGVEAKMVKVKTSSGNVDINECVGIVKIEVETTSGDISIRKEFSCKQFKLESTSGNVYIADNVMVERLETRTTSGSIAIGNFTWFRQLELQTTSADIRIDQGATTEELKAKTSSGKVKVHGKFNNSSIETVNGDIELSVNANNDITVEISTTNGEVQTNLKNIGRINLLTKTINGDVRNSHKEARGFKANVNISTVNGDIYIK